MAAIPSPRQPGQSTRERVPPPTKCAADADAEVRTSAAKACERIGTMLLAFVNSEAAGHDSPTGVLGEFKKGLLDLHETRLAMHERAGAPGQRAQRGGRRGSVTADDAASGDANPDVRAAAGRAAEALDAALELPQVVSVAGALPAPVKRKSARGSVIGAPA